MAKELVLIIFLIASLTLIIKTFNNLSQLNLTSGFTTVLKYLTLLFPVVGFFVVLSLKKKAKVENS